MSDKRRTVELLSKANEQKYAGMEDLANFVLTRSSKSLDDLIPNTSNMEAVGTKIPRNHNCRMDIIQLQLQI